MTAAILAADVVLTAILIIAILAVIALWVFSPSKKFETALDNIAAVYGHCRHFALVLESVPEKDRAWLVWNPLSGYYEETDEHFRQRIIDAVKSVKPWI